MINTMIIACECGSLSANADLHKGESNHRIVCYCDDCQSYARHLGSPATVLDTHGGTDIIQLSPAHFKLAHGREHLGVLRLSPNGLLRWYATCCNTPICNTPANLDMPYLGLLTRNFQKIKKKNKHNTKRHAASNDENDIQTLIGSVSFGVGAGSQHPVSADWPVAKGFCFRGLLYTLKNIGRWRLRGDQKRSELLDAETGEPVVKPYVLTLEERQSAANVDL
jgi:hypothetical protein